VAGELISVQSVKNNLKAVYFFAKMLRKILKKIKRKDKEKKEYPNRFLKFYHLNKKRLNKYRRGSYKKKKRLGLCVRCSNKIVPGIVFCSYHQRKQKEYNKKARQKG